MRGLVRGWSPTLIEYSIRGFGNFGFYEFLKMRIVKRWNQ